MTFRIQKNTSGHYNHEDPLLGRKLLRPDTEEMFATLTPNLEIDLTRFAPIINTPEMRRHREVKQLGALFWEYPDATHTRFAHMLMSYKITRDMLQHFNLSEHEKLHTLAYALIHDIGHTPYSHELEEIVDLDQEELARKIIQRPHFQEALGKCDIYHEVLLTYFNEKKPNPLKQIISHKVIGADKLAYLFRDGIATGKGGYDNIDLITQHTIFENGLFGIDEKGAESALKQILLYHLTYVSTYFNARSKCNQRIFTLLGQIALEDSILPENWCELNDLWFDHHIILAEKNNQQLRKLGARGIVEKNYNCAGSLRLKGAEQLENSGAHIENITEQEYQKFLSIPVRKRKNIEEKLCKKINIEPLDLIVAHGGDISRLKINDTMVFKNNAEKTLWLLENLHPHIKIALEQEEKLQATTIRFYPRKEHFDKVKKQMPEIMQEFKKIIKEYN